VCRFIEPLDGLLLGGEAVVVNQVHQQLVLIGLFHDVLSPLDLQESLILSVDAMDFFLGQLLQMQELHQDLKE